MIRFITADDYVELSPFDITGVFVERMGPKADFTQRKPYKQYTVSIETADRILDFSYKILSNFFEKFETEFCEGIVDDINEFILDYARVYQEHKPQGYVKLDIDDIVSRNLSSTSLHQINAVTQTSIIIEGMYELEPAEKHETEDDMEAMEEYEDADIALSDAKYDWYKAYGIEQYDDECSECECECDDCWDRSSMLWPWEVADSCEEDDSSEESEQCMCSDCETEFERQITPYIKKVIKDMKTKKGM